jgi:DNA polymerase-1
VSSLVSAKKDFDIHLRVCKTAKVDLSRHSLFNIIPESTILKLALERLKAIKSLALYYSKNDLEWYSSYLLPFSRTLCEIEQNGIYVDVDRASFELKNSDIEVVKSLSANIVQTNINGYVYSKFDPCGGKTGRIRVTGGFNCHSIPHGISREMLISRYEAGKIAVFDYNAIDYRSIISSIGGEIAKEYEGCNDFHTKTAEIFLNKLPIDSVEKRDLVKKLAYICMYGGSEDTAAQRSGLSVFNVRKFMIAFDNRFPQITKFRSDLYSSAMKSGYVITPFGKKINVSKDDHSGKVLGLYAQTFSSYVFAKALIKVNEALKECKTKIIFTVHDELVLDVHENEIEILPRIKSLMENVDSFKFHVNVKIGDNYGIASN